MRPVTAFLALLPLAFSGCSSPTSGSGAGNGGSNGAVDAAGNGAGHASKYARMDPDPQYLKKADSRTFAIEYTAQVKDVPQSTGKLRMWVPVPQDTPVQKITNLTFQGAQPKIGIESKYGNRIAYWEIDKPPAVVEAKYSFTCTRSEQVTDLAALTQDGKETDAKAATFLKDDKLTIVDGRIRKMAEEITSGKTTALDKSRAIYQYVLDHMKYDKSGQGWGNGDTNYACDVGKGNCTDFHALFMSLTRASGVPAGFEIGLYLPYEKGKQETPGGYHCWSFFRVPGKTWVPVDASEAGRNPDRASYFFGAHTPNRVTLSVGRDLVLEPKQEGAPLNYLLNPYVEVDGKPLAATKAWTYRDV
jgi:transglutaminase-like putative cysteine protease